MNEIHSRRFRGVHIFQYIIPLANVLLGVILPHGLVAVVKATQGEDGVDQESVEVGFEELVGAGELDGMCEVLDG